MVIPCQCLIESHTSHAAFDERLFFSCSLLDVIAGRKDPKGLKGTLLIDGKLQPKNYKCMCGYVVQVCFVT